jgi:hypothetical protein
MVALRFDNLELPFFVPFIIAMMNKPNLIEL